MIRWGTRRPAAVAACATALVLAGAVAFTRLPLATRTAVELPRLEVRASWPGASAELVETYVTSPIEAAVQGVRGVDRIASESGDGTAELTVELEPGADVRLTRLAVLERLDLLRGELPDGVRAPTVGNYVPEELDEEPLLVYDVVGPYTPGTLERLIDERIAPVIGAVTGVSGVQGFGGAEPGVAVSYDPQRLRQLGVSPAALADALRGSRLVRSLGEERLGASARAVLLRDEPGAAAALAELPVVGAGGLVHRLGDLASVRPEEDAAGRFYRVDGAPAVSLTVGRLAGADAIRTAAGVRAAMDRLAPTLPPGIRVRLARDGSEELEAQLRDLVLRGALAFLAVLVILVAALRDARGVALVMATAAVAIGGTALGLYLLGIPANLLTLAGLGMGIGVLVQNGLVVVERLRLAGDTPAERARTGRRILPAVVGSTLTTAVVLLPFLYLQGDARAAFLPFAAAFGLALAWSVAAALVVVPALGRGGAGRVDEMGAATGVPIAARWRRGYGAVAAALARHAVATLGAALLVVGALGWVFVAQVPKTSFGAWWLGERTTLTAWLDFPRGSDPEALDRGIREFEALAVGVPGVEQVVARGTGDAAYLRVLFTQEAARTALPYQMEEALTERALLIGGASVSVRGRGPGFASGGSATGSTSRIKVLGYSYAGVERIALDLKSRLERIPRVRNVDVNAGSFFGRERAYTVTLEPDRAALARVGLTGADFAQAVAREVRGPVGAMRLEIGGEELAVELKAAGARERTLDELRAAQVPNPAGAPVRIGDLARVGERETVSNISREDQQYVRIVSYEFRGPGKLAQRSHDALMSTIAVPAGYVVADDVFEWARDESHRGLRLVFAVGVALVVLAVAMVFDSAWAAAVVFLSLPVALAGVVAAFWATGTAFGREAAVGVILVVGLAVNQAILLVDAALAARRRAGARGRRGLTVAEVRAAAEDRVGMVVLVTLVTLASLLPLALGTGADSLFGAIALASAGGTVAGTLGALFVVPALLALRSPRLPAPGRGIFTRRPTESS